MALRISYFLVVLTLLVLPAKLVMSYIQYASTRELIADLETEEHHSELIKVDSKSEYIPVFQSEYLETAIIKNRITQEAADAAALVVPYFSVPTPPPQIVIE